MTGTKASVEAAKAALERRHNFARGKITDCASPSFVGKSCCHDGLFKLAARRPGGNADKRQHPLAPVAAEAHAQAAALQSAGEVRADGRETPPLYLACLRRS